MTTRPGLHHDIPLDYSPDGRRLVFYRSVGVDPDQVNLMRTPTKEKLAEKLAEEGKKVTLMTPLGIKVRPAGNDPLARPQEYGRWPPLPPTKPWSSW